MLTVLVVEDWDDTRDSLAELLALFGHRVRLAACGTDALRAVAEEVPDVILLDIGMPGMDGWEVTQRLRCQASGKQPFVIAVTGCGSDGDRQRSADSGIDVHLVKPTDPAALAALLESIRENLAARLAVVTQLGGRS